MGPYSVSNNASFRINIRVICTTQISRYLYKDWVGNIYFLICLLKETVQRKSNELLFTSILPFATSWEIHLMLPTGRHIKIQPFILFNIWFVICELSAFSQQFIFQSLENCEEWTYNSVPVVRRNPSYAPRTANYTFSDWKSFNIFFANSWGEFLHYIHYSHNFKLHNLVAGDEERWREFSACGLE